MAAIDLARVLRVPGRLALNPGTIYPGTYPFGGTALGKVSEVELDWGLRYVPVVAEEFGEAVEDLRVSELPLLAFTLEQWDSDTIQKIFPSVKTSGSPSGIGGISRINGGARPGFVTALDPILFTPDDPRHPGVLFHRPLPEVARPISFSLEEESFFFLLLRATRDSNGNVYQVDLLEHLSLT